ncbi:MAG: hypothetical protein QOC94_3763, partial [Actinoplanes sp.]|nr:hypothetical protein [Actinoplanes sp.]
VPGLLHTAEYATCVLRRVISFYEIPDDVDAGVSTRMQRQQILYDRGHQFHFVLAQQALRTTVGDRRPWSASSTGSYPSPPWHESGWESSRLAAATARTLSGSAIFRS